MFLGFSSCVGDRVCVRSGSGIEIFVKIWDFESRVQIKGENGVLVKGDV